MQHLYSAMEFEDTDALSDIRLREIE